MYSCPSHRNQIIINLTAAATLNLVNYHLHTYILVSRFKPFPVVSEEVPGVIRLYMADMDLIDDDLSLTPNGLSSLRYTSERMPSPYLYLSKAQRFYFSQF